MKKFFAAIAAFVLIQNALAQTNIAIKGGYNYCGAHAIYGGAKQPTEYLSGYGLGVLFKIPFEGVLHFSPHIDFNSRGYIIKPTSGNVKKLEHKIQYLDLVAALSADFKFNNNSLVLSFGPGMGFTNFGKEKSTDNNNVTTSKKIEFGYLEQGWFDLGFSGGIGFHMKKFFAEAAYFVGSSNLNNNVEFDGRSIRDNMLSFNIGYYLK